jgi:hypothetical protein
MDTVECHSGFTYAEKPVAIIWKGRRLEVDAILASWNSPDEKCFRVLAGGRRVFDLIYHENENEWQIQPISGG